MAGPDSNDNIKEKVQSVREVVLGKSNNEIVLVLQYYDYNVEKAIQAYLEDGAKEALGEWHVPPAKPNKKKKNKKKAANASQADNGASTPTGGAAAPVSLSSSLSSQPPSSSPQPLPQRVPPVNGISSSNSSSAETSNSSSSKPLLSNGMVYSGSIPDGDVTDLVEDRAMTASAAESSSSTGAVSLPPVSIPSTKQQQHHRAHTGSHSHGHAHGHGHTQRNRTASERSTASSVGAGGDNHPKRPFQGLEKSIKDLQRQTTSLGRLHLLLDHEIERSCKSIKTVFEEMRAHLNTREKEIMTEMDVVKQQAYEVFKMREEKAAALKVHIERAERLSESELVDLRSDVKHFVADRKVDEELGKTTRFLYDSDHLKEEILNFGEVVPVKTNYTVRRPSVSSVASSGPGAEEVPPSSLSLHPDPAPPVASSQAEENSKLTTEELVQLQIRLQNSLKLQGLAEDRKPSANGNNNPASAKDEYQTKSARRRNRNRERQEQRKNEEESMVTSSPSGESTSRAATPSSTHASAGSASPSPQRGQRSSPQRGGGYRGGRGRGGAGGGGGYRGGQYQGRGSPRRPYSAGRGGGRGGGGDYNRQGGGRPVVVNGRSS